MVPRAPFETSTVEQPPVALQRQPEPCALVVFGASGDLARRKLFPALYALAYRRLLPRRFALVGVARTPQSTEQFVTVVKESVQDFARDPFRQHVWEELEETISYVSADPAGEGDRDAVGDALARVDVERGTLGNRLYYLAVPPPVFGPIVEQIGRRGARESNVRLVVEKPFGRDLDSARELNALLGRSFAEDQIFRIDHYLGKEAVQNVLALRFANGVFEPIWNRQFVEHVQITVAETIGIEGRAGFYEQTGTIRDIFQNHLLQLLALTAMEPPHGFGGEAIRDEKVKVLRALQPPGPASVVRGQHGPGVVDRDQVPGYRDEPGVDPASPTETYVAAKLHLDTWRWAGTPFYVRAGKRLARRETTIAIQFKQAPRPLFEPLSADGPDPNVLLIRVQPDEGVSLGIGAKIPGAGMNIGTVQMDFQYGGAFEIALPEAYERLVLDALLGDATLFTRKDEVEEQWRIVDAIVAGWESERPSFPNYRAGSWGPTAADELIRGEARAWRP